jgi:hypothetical protein
VGLAETFLGTRAALVLTVRYTTKMTPEERRTAAAQFRQTGQRTGATSELPTRPRPPVHLGFAALGSLTLVLAPVAVFGFYFYEGGLPAGRQLAVLIGLPALPFLALSAYCWEKSGIAFRVAVEWAGIILAVSFGIFLIAVIVWATVFS